jgi:hypothetical protein
MNLNNIIKRSTDFGTCHSRKDFVSFALKCIFYIVPAVVLGNYTDIIIQKTRKNKEFGDYILYYILLQTLVIISTLYLILLLNTSYINELQLTIAGSFFVVLYFGIQTNYIIMIKEHMNH